MIQPGRKYSATHSYRYGFNGKENENEVKGEGLQLDYGFRIYDTRLGRFFSVDPLIKKYPWFAPYQFAGNMPTRAVDLDGAEIWIKLFKNPFSEENTTKLKNNLGVEKGSVREKIIDFIAGAGDRGRDLSDPTTYIKGAWDHGVAMVENTKGIVTAKNPLDALNSSIKLLIPGSSTAQQTAQDLKNGNFRSAGGLFTDLTLAVITHRVSATKPTYTGFTKAESVVINEAKSILQSEKMQSLIDGVKKGEFTKVEINGRPISYDPEIPTGKGYRGITDTEVKGFRLSGDAFTNFDELSKAVLHELHRLKFSEIVKKGEATGPTATTSTKSADAFAVTAHEEVIKKN